METIMATPAFVAERDRVTKQAVTKLVRRLVEEHGLPVERDGRDRVIRFSLPHYDNLRHQFASSEKVSTARTERPAPHSEMPDSSTSRDEALRQEAWLKVAREKLRQQEEIGQLVRADRMRQALTSSGRDIQNVVSRLQNRADEMAIAVSKEGVHGLRVLLRQISAELNAEIAAKLTAAALLADELDPLIEVDQQ